MIICIAGDYKTGKTVSACTFPKPLLLVDFDDGAKSVVNAKDKTGKLIIPDHDQIEVVTFRKKGTYDLSFTTEQKGAIAPPYTKDSLAVMKQYNLIIREVAEAKRTYKTVVIDSMTNMFLVWKECILAANNRPSLQIADYGTLESALKSQFIPTLKSLPCEFVILIDHIDADKDETTGAIAEFPVGPSRQQGKLMGLNFDEMWRQVVEGEKYLWYTRKKGLFNAGSRLGLPNPIEANYTTLRGYLK